jgi:spermidine synthase
VPTRTPGPGRNLEPPITLSEQGGIRYLHFGSEWVQGAMSIRRPWDIPIDYVEQMMAWLLFLDPPKRILQLGLGAGALTRWCWRHLPASGIDVVESSRRVIRVVREQFALPADDDRLAVHHDDAARFVALAARAGGVRGPSPRGAGGLAPGARWGVVQADLYDRHARGPVCDSLSFYRHCRAALDPGGGMLVVNLFGEHASCSRNLARIAAAFDARLLTLPPVAAGNLVALAFAGPPLRCRPASCSRAPPWSSGAGACPRCAGRGRFWTTLPTVRPRPARAAGPRW